MFLIFYSTITVGESPLNVI